MIYEIETSQIPLALQNNGKLIIISADSLRALIQITNIESLTILNTYNDEDLNSLLADDRWRQPCTNC